MRRSRGQRLGGLFFADQGIGEGLARALAEAGAQVVLMARTLESIQKLALELNGLAVALDVTKVAEIQPAFERVQRRFGQLDLSYEVPLITVVTNLRKLVSSPGERVGVVLRAPLAGFVERRAALASCEKIQVSRGDRQRFAQRLAAQASLAPHQATRRRDLDLERRSALSPHPRAGSLVSPAQSFGTFAFFRITPRSGAKRQRSCSTVQVTIESCLKTVLVQVRERFSLQRKRRWLRFDRIIE